MANKRNATSDLNHTNWDREDEPEQAGSFQKASDKVLERRIIRTAKRRNPISSSPTSTNSKSAFGSFTAFSKTAPVSTPFDFLNNLSKTQEEPKSNGLNNGSPKANTSPMFKTSNAEKDEEYFARLKGLNQSVSNWIKKHVDANPFLNLKPIFKDYERYFDDLEKLKTDSSVSSKTDLHVSSKTDSSVSSKTDPPVIKSDDNKTFSPTTKKELSSFVFKPVESDNKTDGSSKIDSLQFSFGSNAKRSDSISAAKVTGTSSLFQLAGSTKSDAAKETPQFNFGTPTSSATFNFSATSKSNTGFSFGASNSTPFAFTNVSGPSKEADQEKEEADEEESPAVEFTPVVENDNVYTIKCKVFVKKDNNFGDRGVGNLYLKPVPNSEKIQLIVRADTNLGNLLCNFILSKSIPTKRMGKRDVMLVCLPMPESKPPPVPILLRVKSTEDADELLRVLEKNKK